MPRAWSYPHVSFTNLTIILTMKLYQFWAPLLLCATLLSTPLHARNSLTLHYNRPADYFEEALVIGNGTMGAIVYGGTDKDVLSLNDITLWTGEPEKEVYTPDAYKAIPEIRALLDKGDYKGADRKQRKVQGHYSENYQPLGQLSITYLDASAKITGYERSLDISQAIANTAYLRDGNRFGSEYFASAPDSVIVLRLTTESANGLQAMLSFTSQLRYSATAQGNEISAEGYAAYHSLPSYYRSVKNRHLYDPDRGTHFRTLIRVIAPESKVQSYATGELKITGGNDAVILIANATSFNGFDKDPVREGREYRKAVAQRMNRAAVKQFNELKSRHIADYKHFFDRVTLNLGKTDSAITALPTDEQLLQYTEQSQNNPELEALYFQYGRYLLISSSRTPGVPANLQGLWNEKILPPWSSNYTTNINLQENYWAAETTNLSEMHQPLMDFITSLNSNGEASAQAYYGVEKGWCVGQNTDIWAMTCPVGLHAGDPSWACWTMGGAWVSTHIWERYAFNRDKQFLKQYYPALKGAAEFCMNWLIEKDGKLLTSPGTSPENKYVTPEGYVGATSYGCTADLAMTRECLIDAAKAARALGTDQAFVKQIEKALARLLPYRIGRKGNLQEWYYDWEDQDPQHRHQSHLFGLYPGHHLSVQSTPDLAKACAKTLEIKGDNTTGWSTGWRINLFARLLDGEKAYHIYRCLLRYISPDSYSGKDAHRGGGTYPNLLDAHSPFQIDGNFGGCAGVAEMLMQSTESTITLLPALPQQWSAGSVKGLCARGGFVVDMEWKDGKVTSLTVTAKAGGKTRVYFNGSSKNASLKSGESLKMI